MRTVTLLFVLGCAGVTAAALWSSPATAASHQWRFNEIFSNHDGTVQFIEMKECCGFVAETQLHGKWILLVDAANQFDFPYNLNGNTANRHLLLATQGFADLPEAPTPDFIIPDNFLPLGDDTLQYWFYDNATWSYSGLPLDGRTSLGQDGSTPINSPTNYAGETGSIDVAVPVLQATWSAIKAGWGMPPLVP